MGLEDDISCEFYYFLCSFKCINVDGCFVLEIRDVIVGIEVFCIGEFGYVVYMIMYVDCVVCIFFVLINYGVFVVSVV